MKKYVPAFDHNSMYVWSKVDSYFWDFLYIFNLNTKTPKQTNKAWPRSRSRSQFETRHDPDCDPDPNLKHVRSNRDRCSTIARSFWRSSQLQTCVIIGKNGGKILICWDNCCAHLQVVKKVVVRIYSIDNHFFNYFLKSC